MTTRRASVLSLLVALGGLPVAFLLTFLMLPVWSWIERNCGIESVGHSGPAAWCFVAVYLALLLGGFGLPGLIRLRNAPKKHTGTGSRHSHDG